MTEVADYTKLQPLNGLIDYIKMHKQFEVIGRGSAS
jgi:hypothetical protein